MAAMDQLVKLMQLKKMQDDAAYRANKFAYQRHQDQIQNDQWKKTYDLNKLVKDRLLAKEKRELDRQGKEDEFKSDYAAYLPRIMADDSGNREEFVKDIGEFGSDYTGALPKDYIANALKSYDTVHGKIHAGYGRPTLVQNVENPDDPSKTLAILASPDGTVRQYTTVPTAGQMLSNDPENRAAIKAAEKEAEANAAIMKDLRAKSWEGYNKATQSNARLDQAEATMNTWKPGPGSNVRKLFNSVMPFFGMEPNDALSDQQVFEALTGMDMLAARNPKGEIGGLTGATSDKDVELLRSMVRNAGMTPKAIKIMIDFQREVNKRKVEMFKIVNGHEGDSQSLKKKLMEYKEKHPLSIHNAGDIDVDLDKLSLDQLMERL